MTIIELTCRQRLAAAVEGRQIYKDENEMMIMNLATLIFVENTLGFFFEKNIIDFSNPHF